MNKWRTLPHWTLAGLVAATTALLVTALAITATNEPLVIPPRAKAQVIVKEIGQTFRVGELGFTALDTVIVISPRYVRITVLIHNPSSDEQTVNPMLIRLETVTQNVYQPTLASSIPQVLYAGDDYPFTFGYRVDDDEVPHRLLVSNPANPDAEYESVLLRCE